MSTNCCAKSVPHHGSFKAFPQAVAAWQERLQVGHWRRRFFKRPGIWSGLYWKKQLRKRLIRHRLSARYAEAS